MRYCPLQRDGNNALTLAAYGGHIEVVHAILNAPGVNVNHANVSIYISPLLPLVFLL